MDKFIARDSEMEILQNEYDRNGSSLVILYGRRRMGKTTLISEFIKDKPALFFLANEESDVQNKADFSNKAAEFIDSYLLRTTKSHDWFTIFSMIMSKKFAKKPIIVIDEFQYLGKSNPAFLPLFRRIWEEILKPHPVMVILCGSLIPIINSQALAYNSPLYGLSTAQIMLKEIPFRQYKQFFPQKSERQLIEMYSVTGGVPKYVDSFAEYDDIYEAIEKTVLNPMSCLYDEPRFLLQQEVSEIGSYFSVIRAIAAGNRKLSAIASMLEVKSTSLTKYLKTLIDLDILEREVSVTEDNPEKSKRGLYKIKDNYIRFWFTFIYPNMSFIESGNAEIAMKKIRDGLIIQQTASAYKDICREKMWELNASGVWPFRLSKVGWYWSGNTEIDIAAIDSEGKNIILGECKYQSEPTGIEALLNLEEKTKDIAWHRDTRKVRYVLFSVNGFTPELEKLAERREDVLLAN